MKEIFRVHKLVYKLPAKMFQLFTELFIFVINFCTTTQHRSVLSADAACSLAVNMTPIFVTYFLHRKQEDKTIKIDTSKKVLMYIYFFLF